MKKFKSLFGMVDTLFLILFTLGGFGLLSFSLIVGGFLGYKMYVGAAVFFGMAALIGGDRQ